MIDERRAAANAATRDRVRAASAAASAVAATAAMPGELEDLGGGGGGGDVEDAASIPDKAEIDRLRVEVKQRVAELTRAMTTARDAAASLAEQAKAATGDEAAQLERKSDAERTRMHSLLAELATLDNELKELERVAKLAADAPRVPPRASAPSAEDLSDLDGIGDVRIPRSPPRSVDDALSELKRKAGNPAAGKSASSGSPPPASNPPPPKKKSTTVEDELAALKQKMQSAPPRKK